MTEFGEIRATPKQVARERANVRPQRAVRPQKQQESRLFK